MEIFKEEAIELFGGVRELASALGISTAAVYQWKDDAPIPAEKALRIRYELRPDAFDSTGIRKASAA